MGGILINSGVINYGGLPSGGSGLLAARPAAGVVGRIYIASDSALLYRDTGSAWVTIGGAGGPSGSGAAGQATFWTGASVISGDNAFFWDNTNKRLGLGTITPGVRLDVHGTGVLQQLNGTTTNNAYLDFQNAGSTQWRLGNFYNGASQQFTIFNAAGLSTALTIFQNAYINVPIGMSIGGVSSAILLNLNTANAANQLWLQSNVGTNPSYMNFKNSFNNYIGVDNSTGTAMLTTGGSAYAFTLVTESAYPVIFGTNNTERIRIDSTGKVGIGYSAPAVGLATSGNASIAQNTANANYNLITSQFFCAGFSFTNTTVSTSTPIAAPFYSGYVCTATLTLTLPAVSGLNFIFYIIANSGATVTVQRSGSDVILDKLGVSQTSVVVAAGTRALFYLGGGSTTYQIF
jgi:hypothetical protein